MNSKVIIGIIVVLIILVGGYFVLGKSNKATAPATTQTQSTPATTSATATKNAVTISNFAFSPATITIKSGDSITWTNQDSVGHSATADDNSFDTGILSQGQSGSVTFKNKGTFTYHCSVHPNMKATVVVE